MKNIKKDEVQFLEIVEAIKKDVGIKKVLKIENNSYEDEYGDTINFVDIDLLSEGGKVFSIKGLAVDEITTFDDIGEYKNYLEVETNKKIEYEEIRKRDIESEEQRIAELREANWDTEKLSEYMKKYRLPE